MTTRRIAFVAVMAALANLLGILKLSVGPITIHMLQLPIILTALVAGASAGGTVGLVGAVLGAFTLSPPNPYILLGNAILGLFTGLFYTHLRNWKTTSLTPQFVAVSAAFLLQAPYAYLTDVYLMSIPSSIAKALLPIIFVEDLFSLLICYAILSRVDVAKYIGRA